MHRKHLASATLAIISLLASAPQATAEPFRMSGVWDYVLDVSWTSQVPPWQSTFSPDGTTLVAQNLLGVGCVTTCTYDVRYQGCEDAADLSACTVTTIPSGGTFELCPGPDPFGFTLQPNGDWRADLGGPPNYVFLRQPATTAGSCTSIWPACGNGSLDPGEACDDGNAVSFDGCSAACQIEPCVNSAGENVGGIYSPVGEWLSISEYDPSPGLIYTCRNRLTLAPDNTLTSAYACDNFTPDGNIYFDYDPISRTASYNGDSIGNICSQFDVDFSSSALFAPGTMTCTPGSGYTDLCRDGSRDGVCDTAAEWQAHIEALTCGALPECGDGVPDSSAGEECDDGNLNNGDGCSAVCQIEPYRLTGTWDWSLEDSEDRYPATFSDDGLWLTQYVTFFPEGCAASCRYAVSYADCDGPSDAGNCTASLSFVSGQVGSIPCPSDPAPTLLRASEDRWDMFGVGAAIAFHRPATTANQCEQQEPDPCEGGIRVDRRASLGTYGTSAVSLAALSPTGSVSLKRLSQATGDAIISAPLVKMAIASQAPTVAANSIRRGRNSQITGTQLDWTDPATTSTEVCPVAEGICDTSGDRLWFQNTSRTVAPGSYLSLEVDALAEVVLSEPGLYDFCRIDTRAGAKIRVESPGVVIRVDGRIRTGRGSSIEATPENRPTLQAMGLVKLGNDSTNTVKIEAPGQTVKLGRGGTLDGTVCATTFISATGVELSCSEAD